MPQTQYCNIFRDNTSERISFRLKLLPTLLQPTYSLWNSFFKKKVELHFSITKGIIISKKNSFPEKTSIWPKKKKIEIKNSSLKLFSCSLLLLLVQWIQIPKTWSKLKKLLDLLRWRRDTAHAHIDIRQKVKPLLWNLLHGEFLVSLITNSASLLENEKMSSTAHAHMKIIVKLSDWSGNYSFGNLRSQRLCYIRLTKF